MTNQPTWKLVYATDCSALYIDETGVYPPELMIAQDSDDDSVYVYRFPLDRLIRNADDSVTNEHGHREWFQTCHAGLGRVADFVGSTERDLLAALCSDDPGTRAVAYEAIGDYHGYDNLDSYPDVWTSHAFESWPDKGPDTDPEADEEIPDEPDTDPDEDTSDE